MVRASAGRPVGVVVALLLGVLLGPVTRGEAQSVPMCIGCTPDYKVQVTPDASAISRVAGTLGLEETFTVKNVGLYSDSYTLTCSTTGNVTCTNIAPSTFSLSANQTQVVTVTYNTGVAGSGNLTARAQGASDFWDTGSYAVTVTSAPPPPTVTLVLPTLTSGSRAVVARRRPVVRALFTSPIAIDTTQTVLKWKGQVVTGLARHGRGVLEWEVDSARAIALGDSGLIEVTACASGCTTVSRYAVLPSDDKPLLGFTGMPLGALGAGFASPFGPGLAVAQAEVETGLAIPGWQAMGIGRGAGLVYSTRQSYPRALVLVDLELTWPAGTPDAITLRLWDGGVTLDTLKLTSPSCATGAARRCRAVLQGDMSGSTFPTPTRKYLKVEAVVTSGGTSKTNVDSAEVVLVDRRTTAYGSGWWPAGVSQLVVAGEDRLLIGPTGTATIYRGNGDTSFVAPPGVFVALTKSGTGFALTARGSTASIVFNASGQQVAMIDRNLNADSVHYDGSGRVARFWERTGKRDTLAYDGNGKLATITDPGGRVTAITISGTTHQLTYDSVRVTPSQAPVHRYTYQAYPGTGTVVLTRRIGAIEDTTLVTYDSTFRRRPVQVALPSVPHPTSGTLVAPLVQYTAYERRGVGALVSLDSAYVMMTDPRGFWSKALLTRWGQSVRSWDQLGLLGRSSFDADGFVLWSEGKVADSSRSYQVYDAARRLIKRYIVRAVGDTLRGDSLVYDAAHRVIQVVDNRGKSSYVTYDAHGNVTKQKGPTNDSTLTWVRFNGMVDSVRLPGETASQRYTYDPDTRQVEYTIDALGDTVSGTWYDGLGRLDTTRTRIRGDSLNGYAWSKVRYHYMPVGLVDTALSYRAFGTDPASITWPSETDTLNVTRSVIRYDRAGRDTSRINTRGVTSLVRYDALGRVVSTRGQVDSMAVRDSLVYDLAGNVVTQLTRRGDTLTANYDARNRDTLRVIPTIGTERKTYGGPLDQLTLWEITGYVDSIGGLNPKQAWSYDQRGRLLTETSYPLGSARTITFQYDAWERPYRVTDPVGMWTTKYEVARGYPVILNTPFGDSLTYAWDAQGRPTQVKYYGDYETKLTVSNAWNPSGAFGFRETVHTPSTQVLGRWQRLGTPSASPPVLSKWQEWDGSTLQAITFNSTYDGQARLTGLEQIGSSGLLSDRDYQFDANANVRSSGMMSATFTRMDRLLSMNLAGTTWSYTYDSAGNTVTASKSGESWAYGYDALNRLVSARRNGALISRYAYDVSGRRIAKRVYSSASGGTVGFTSFVYRGDNVAFDTDSSGTITWKYVWGLGSDDLIAARDGSGNHYFAITDQLGSVRGVVRRTGSVAMRLRYDAYGQLMDSTGVGVALRYRWTGREWDAELGKYHFRARAYDPHTLRFMQEDPIGKAGGSNVYAYAAGSPLAFRDPTGLAPDPVKTMPGPSRCWTCHSGDAVYYDGVPVESGWWLRAMPGVTLAPSVFVADRVWLEQRTGLRGNSDAGSIRFAGRSEDREACRLSPTCSSIWLAVASSGIPTYINYTNALAGMGLTEGKGQAGPGGLTGINIFYSLEAAAASSFEVRWGLPINGHLVLTHELAHAEYLIMAHEGLVTWSKGASNAFAVEWENRARSEYYGYGVRPRHER